MLAGFPVHRQHTIVTPSPLPQKDPEVPNLARFPAEKRSDASLVAGAARGERAAIAEVWDRYSGLVRGVLYGAMGPDDHIEDLVQEVFLGFIKGAKNIDQGAALRGYLASMAVRQAAFEIRKRKVRRWVGLSPTGELPERRVERVDFENRGALKALEAIIVKLSERKRMAYVLRRVQGLELLEIAAALNISESTLRRELDAADELVNNAAAREPALAEYLARKKGVSS
jgi:RNA polymerase sigma-70 factor (ECF subfamily)